mgnify:CR=1 FL=1
MTEKKKKPHYVNNKEFLQAMIEWNNRCKEAKKEGKPQPPITNYIGECFLKIANHLSYRPNFINYSYRDEMISDGIQNCLQYAHNFDPEKSKNPFAYFTQIIYYAFIRRIAVEKKQVHVKNMMIEKQSYESFVTMEGDDTVYNIDLPYDVLLNQLDHNVEVRETKKQETKKKGLEIFMEKDV